MAYDKLKLTSNLYSKNSFTSALEDLDPSANYIGTDLEGLDAYERQLKRFEIKVVDEYPSTIEEFFQTKDSAVLFPEFVKREVNKGIAEYLNAHRTELVDQIAVVSNVGSPDYRGIYYDSTTCTIKTSDQLTTMHRLGRKLLASYEAIKYQKVDLFAVMLRQIGKSIGQLIIEEFKKYKKFKGSYKYEMVTTPVSVDYEKLIYRDFEGVEIFKIVGFNKICKDEP